MMMEFRIADIVEKFRTLLTYKQITDQRPIEEAFRLEYDWAELVLKAKKKDVSLNSSKQLFAKET
jgi:dynein heavy chain, axonemal